MNLEKSDDLNQETVAIKKKKMTVEQFFQQFNTLDMNNYGSWPLSVKITCWIFIFLAVLALGYFVVIKSQLEAIANAQAKEQSLLNEFKEKEKDYTEVIETLANRLIWLLIGLFVLNKLLNYFKPKIL